MQFSKIFSFLLLISCAFSLDAADRSQRGGGHSRRSRPMPEIPQQLIPVALYPLVQRIPVPVPVPVYVNQQVEIPVYVEINPYDEKHRNPFFQLVTTPQEFLQNAIGTLIAKYGITMIGTPDLQNMTAIHFALQQNRPDVAHMLLTAYCGQHIDSVHKDSLFNTFTASGNTLLLDVLKKIAFFTEKTNEYLRNDFISFAQRIISESNLNRRDPGNSAALTIRGYFLAHLQDSPYCTSLRPYFEQGQDYRPASQQSRDSALRTSSSLSSHHELTESFSRLEMPKPDLKTVTSPAVFSEGEESLSTTPAPANIIDSEVAKQRAQKKKTQEDARSKLQAQGLTLKKALESPDEELVLTALITVGEDFKRLNAKEFQKPAFDFMINHPGMFQTQFNLMLENQWYTLSNDEKAQAIRAGLIQVEKPAPKGKKNNPPVPTTAEPVDDAATITAPQSAAQPEAPTSHPTKISAPKKSKSAKKAEADALAYEELQAKELELREAFRDCSTAFLNKTNTKKPKSRLCNAINTLNKDFRKIDSAVQRKVIDFLLQHPTAFRAEFQNWNDIDELFTLTSDHIKQAKIVGLIQVDDLELIEFIDSEDLFALEQFKNPLSRILCSQKDWDYMGAFILALDRKKGKSLLKILQLINDFPPTKKIKASDDNPAPGKARIFIENPILSLLLVTQLSPDTKIENSDFYNCIEYIVTHPTCRINEYYDHHGYLPIHLTTYLNEPDIAELLLANKANVYALRKNPEEDNFTANDLVGPDKPGLRAVFDRHIAIMSAADELAKDMATNQNSEAAQ